MEFKKPPIFFILFIFFTPISSIQAQIKIDTSPYKIALSFDGNAHDADDIVAAPMALAIIAEAGLKDRVIHVDYSNHIWHDGGSSNDIIENQVMGMSEAINGTLREWNYKDDIFFEARIASALNAAKNNFARKVADAYNAREPFYYLLGGPMEVPYQCILEVPSYQRSQITVISHSFWNKNHIHGNSRTWEHIKKTGVKVIIIADQNTYDCRSCSDDDDMSTSQFSKWKWLKKMGGKYKWLYNQNPFISKFDPSDAGMAWWVITGRPGVKGVSAKVYARNDKNEDPYASPAKVEELFKRGALDPGNTGYFFIVSKATGKKIRPENDSDNARIVQVSAAWDYDTVQWEQIFTENDYFYLKNKATGKYFRPDSNHDFSEIIQKPTTYNGQWTQWKKVDTGDGYFHLENRGTGKRFRVNSTDDLTSGKEYFTEQSPKSWTGDWVRWKFVDVNKNVEILSKQKDKTSLNRENFELVEYMYEGDPEIKVYPNPANTYLNIAGITQDTQMKVFDMRGNILMDIFGQNTINVSDLPTGTYLLSVGGKLRQRFIKR